jgi:DnaJ-domain-containing protein 1
VDDLGRLKKIEAELQQRTVPTALRLLEKVQLQMKRLAAEAPVLNANASNFVMSATAPIGIPLKASLPRQAGLGQAMPGLDKGQTAFDLGEPEFSAPPPPPQALAPSAPKEAPVIQAKPASPVNELTAEQAYRLLKVAPSANWTEVEASRRALVGKAQPDKIASLQPAERSAIQEEVRQINAAYKLVSQLRAAD